MPQQRVPRPGIPQDVVFDPVAEIVLVHDNENGNLRPQLQNVQQPIDEPTRLLYRGPLF
jgi:hypothetical protein